MALAAMTRQAYHAVGGAEIAVRRIRKLSQAIQLVFGHGYARQSWIKLLAWLRAQKRKAQ